LEHGSNSIHSQHTVTVHSISTQNNAGSSAGVLVHEDNKPKESQHEMPFSGSYNDNFKLFILPRRPQSYLYKVY
jgi:hypothetical protein